MTCQESDAVVDWMVTSLGGMEVLTRAERSALAAHFIGCERCCQRLEARMTHVASHLSPAAVAKNVAEGWARGTKLALADEVANDPEAPRG